MIYSKVVNGNITEGPRDLPSEIPLDKPTEHSWYPTVFLNMPHHIEHLCNPITQIIQPVFTFTGNQVECTHIIENKSAADIASSEELMLQMVREQRNTKLRNTDWTQLADAPITLAQKAAWTVYRQALRDFPAIVQLDNIVWPSVPPIDL